jgi:Alpha/beta hydrolase domain
MRPTSDRPFAATTKRRRSIGVLLAGMLALPLVVQFSTGWAAPAAAEPTPAVQGPVTGGSHGRAFNEWPWPLKDYGYEQAEYFISGTAKAYGATGAPASYAVRIQVIRPVDPHQFSGTAIAEWSNVTAQYEIPLGWVWTHPYAMKHGDVFVLVGAQEVGVCGNKSPTPTVEVCSPTSLKGWDSTRYAALHHPGDNYSFDIYSQAIQAIRHPGRVNPVAGLSIKRVIGYGQSQSAGRMDSYLCNGADAAAKVIDAAVSDADGGTALACTPRVPTIQLWSEDSAKPVGTTTTTNDRIWMLPGSPHEDKWQADYEEAWTNYNNLGQAPSIPDNASMQADAGNYGREGAPSTAKSLTCLPTGDEYPRRYAVDAAVQALTDWVMGKGEAPVVPSIDFTSSAAPLSVGFARDQNLNPLGGLRSPVLDVPVATYVGATCGLFGESIPFTPVQLSQLYPTHQSYVSQMQTAINSQVAKGTLLPEDATDLLQRATASQIGS